MQKNPCHKCGERQPPDCHAWCKRYADWSDQREKARKAKELDENATVVLAHTARRNLRYRHGLQKRGQKQK